MNVPDVSLTQPWIDAIDGWVLQMTCDNFAVLTVWSRESAGRVMARCLIAADRSEPEQVTRHDLTEHMISRSAGAVGREGPSTYFQHMRSFWSWWRPTRRSPTRWPSSAHRASAR